MSRLWNLPFRAKTPRQTPSETNRSEPQGGARRGVPRILMIALVAAFILAVHNNTFWFRAAGIFEGNLRGLVVFAGAIYALTVFTVALIGPGRALKPAMVFLLILSSVTAYYMDSLGVMIDRDMIQNVAKTTLTESSHMLTPRFVMEVVTRGVLPGLVVAFVPLRAPARWPGFWGGLARWVITVVVSLAVLVGLLFSDYKTYSGVFRAHKELMGSYQPGAALGATLRYVKMVLKSADVVVAPLGKDARKGPRLAAAGKPVLTVVVAGETARAESFALNGYARDTNPELSQRDITYFTDVTSCGTATAISLPCMFSNLKQAGYSHDAAIRQENLLDVFTHAGLAVEWWDNNTGHQGNAARVPSRMMAAADDPAACTSGECTDAVFLKMLADKAATITQDTVLVLHMIGSHGPAYHLRYPPEFERFTPACKSTDFAECSNEEIVNAYDNTILFTDHVLAQMIDQLAAQDRVIPVLFFVSDHGESLGENGLYLHGAPWFMAPTQQTHVPMVIWLSEAYKTAFGVDAGCLAAKADLPASHDNLFHTLLGMLDIQTEVHDPELDLMQGCTAPA